jgi:hypothetical protein
MKQPEAAKLTALRARTDGQLIALINRQLDYGLRSGPAAAERVYEEASKLLPVTYGASPAERRNLETKLTRLGGSLRCVCA